MRKQPFLAVLSAVPGKHAAVLANLLLFKLSWLLLVLGQDAGIMPAVLLQACSLLLQPAPEKIFLPTLAVALCGLVLDFSLTLLGVFSFTATLFPPWLLVLWFAFALTLPHGFAFLGRLPLHYQILIGMLAGPFSYGAGYCLGAIDFPLAWLPTLLLLALLWGIFLPLAIRLSGSKLRFEPSTLLLSLLVLASALHPVYAAAILQGKGQVKFLLKTLYEVCLYTDSDRFRFADAQAFTLELHYHHDLSKTRIIRETLRQWDLQEVEPEAAWLAMLENSIPDIRAADTLSLQVDTAQTAKLLHNKQEIALLTDPALVHAFAGIWLAENSTNPELRRKLLGLSP